MEDEWTLPVEPTTQPAAPPPPPPTPTAPLTPPPAAPLTPPPPAAPAPPNSFPPTAFPADVPPGGLPPASAPTTALPGQFGAPGWPPAGSPPAPPASAGGAKRRKGAIVALAAGLGVAALGVGGFVVLGGGGDDSAPASTERERDRRTDPEDTEAPDTEAPDTEAPDTAAPDTEAPDTVTPSAGTIELGNGVAFDVPDGFTITSEPGEVPVTISDDLVTVAMQVLVRNPGEDPQALMQEFVDTFDADFSAVSYAAGRDFTVAGDPYSSHYLNYVTFDAASGGYLVGTGETRVRGDGLSLVIDIYRSDGTVGYDNSDWFGELLAAFAAAPSVGDAGPLPQRDNFRVTSVHPQVTFGSASIGVPIDATVETLNPEVGTVQYLGETFSLHSGTVADLDSAQQLVLAQLGQRLTIGAITPLPDGASTDGRVISRGVQYEATGPEGRALAGVFDLLVHPATGALAGVNRAYAADSPEPSQAFADYLYFAAFFTALPN